MTTGPISNRFRTLRALGEGAMGKVYLVDDLATHQQVALKLVSRQLEHGDKTTLQLRQEFRMMTRLRHPNCCEVYDFGQLPEGEPFFTMEVVPGDDLEELLPLPSERVRDVLGQLCLALACVHGQGFVHRDLKSANVRVTPEGVVKLMDYGLMAPAGQAAAAIAGTIGYLAPEVIHHAPIDRRADLYALGVLGYELLTGGLPFVGARAIDVLRAHLDAIPEPPSRRAAGVDPALERIVLRLLSKEPIRRYQSAEAVREELGFEAPPGIGGSLLTSSLVGRGPQLATLAAWVGRVAARTGGRTVVLEGPAGAGKSRLLEELRVGAQLGSIPAALGRCSEPGGLPYGPFVQALRALLPLARDLVPAALAAAAPVLVELLPELQVPPAPQMDHPAKAKTRLQAEIVALLAAFARERGLVLGLEDWHQADALSRELLAHVVRAGRDLPLLVAVTTRPGGPDLPGAEILPVPALDAGDVGRMVGSMLGLDHPDGALVARVAALSEGSPAYVERLLEHLTKVGLLARAGGAWRLEGDLEAAAAGMDLRGLLGARVDGLPPDALAVARAAAVLGRAADVELLQAISGLPDDALFAALDVLAGQRTLGRDGDGAYAIGQEALRALLYERIPDAERTRLHGQAAQALERRLAGLPLAGARLDDVAAVATHALRSAAPAGAITYALEAGRRYAALFANEEAERFLEAGLALTEGDAWRPQRLQYLRLLGDVRRATGRAAAACETYDLALPLAEALGERGTLGRMLTSRAKALQNREDLVGALADAERALPILQAAGDGPGAARCLDTIGRLRFFRGEIPVAIAQTEAALATARAADETAVVAGALAWLGYLYVAYDAARLDQGLASLEEAIGMLTRLGDRPGLNNAWMLLGAARIRVGAYAAAETCFREARRLCEASGDRTELGFALLNLARIALETGDLAGAEATIAEAGAIAAELRHKYQEGLAALLAGAADVQRGRLAVGAARVAGVLAAARASRNRHLEATGLQYEVEIALHRGRVAQAAAAAAALQALIDETGNTEPQGLLDVFVARIRRAEGATDAADAAIARALAGAVAARADAVRALALAAQAGFALQAEDWPAARALALDGLALATGAGARPIAAELEGILGEAALATGSDEAAERFAAMEALAEAMGAPLPLALARFGRAAARPQAVDARSLAAAAREALGAIAANADPADRAAFLAAPDRARAAAGDYLGHGLRAQPQAPPLGLGLGGGFGML